MFILRTVVFCRAIVVYLILLVLATFTADNFPHVVSHLDVCRLNITAQQRRRSHERVEFSSDMSVIAARLRGVNALVFFRQQRLQPERLTQSINNCSNRLLKSRRLQFLIFSMLQWIAVCLRIWNVNPRNTFHYSMKND